MKDKKCIKCDGFSNELNYLLMCDSCTDKLIEKGFLKWYTYISLDDRFKKGTWIRYKEKIYIISDIVENRMMRVLTYENRNNEIVLSSILIDFAYLDEIKII